MIQAYRKVPNKLKAFSKCSFASPFHKHLIKFFLVCINLCIVKQKWDTKLKTVDISPIQTGETDQQMQLPPLRNKKEANLETRKLMFWSLVCVNKGTV